MQTLGEVLANARRTKGLSLREVEAATEIRNAHLSQIETGTIKKPDLAILWSLARAYDLNYRDLLALAGYLSGPSDSAGVAFEASAAALRSMDSLTEDQLIQVVEYINKIKEHRAERT
jgi:HTH-type transcriptional regulator, competence development regulator